MTTLSRILGSLRGDGAVWPDDTDWNVVLAVAERHGVAMLLADRVSNDLLRDAARRAAESAFHRARQLRGLVSALTAQGIEVLPVKGPVLAVTAYGDPARRGVSGDLDLVIRPRDFQRALACLGATGYTRHEGAFDEVHEHEQWESEAHLFPPALPGTMVELHTDLIGNPHTASVDLDAVLSRAGTRSIFGISMRTPAPEDLLLYLCLHGARHVWSRLLWVCDIDAVIRSEASLDWDALFSRASAIQATRRLTFGIDLAERLLGTEVPHAVRRRIEDDGYRRRAASVVAQRMNDISAGRRVPAFGLRLRSELAMRETRTQRLRYLVRQLTPTPRDRAWLRLPAGFAWLHIVLRPFRLLARYGIEYEKRK